MAKDKVRLSKALSWLLRHNAEKEGFTFLQGGFLPVDDILRHKRFLGGGYTHTDVETVVAECQKQRFTLNTDPQGRLLIRANQGHSITGVEVELEEITDPTQALLVIHGTYLRCWEAILATGLNRMTRNHIHFSAGEPGEGVISGMRKSVDLKIYIDLPKAMAAGIRFFRSSNNVILSSGNQEGSISSEFFLKVKNVKTNTIIYPPTVK